MAHVTEDRPRAHELATARALIGLAALSAAIAAAAGIILIVAAPERGSSVEGALGLTAAVGGLATAAFVIAAAIYAQVKDLWRYAPTWLRLVAWAVIVFAVASMAWNLITQIS